MPLLTPSERIGTTVAHRYSLTRIAGQGASAVLFAGRDLSLERDVAVKVMRPDGALVGSAERERFRREAHTLAKLRYPNLVEVYDVGETSDGMPFVAMELLQGESLAERLERSETVSPSEALAIALPLMGALACAHDLGVIHRDVKPANVFLQDGGSRGVVPKLLDFGIAKVEARSGLTSSGLALGTPAYMAPEQARGEPLGPQADVWAMGVMLFRMLSGRLPFEASTAAGVLWEATRGGPSPLAALVPHLDRALAACVERALVPDLARRHADMRSFAESLTRTARRIGLTMPNASELAGLPGYSSWCDATDAEVRTAPHAAAHETQAGATPDLTFGAGAESVRPEATQATRSQANLVARPRRLGRASLAALVASILALSVWSMLSTSHATQVARPAPRAVTSGAAVNRPAAVSKALEASPEEKEPPQAPLAPSLVDAEPTDVKPKVRTTGPRRSPGRPPRAVPKADVAAAPKPKLVTDFEW